MLSGFRGENANGYFLIVTAAASAPAFEARKIDVEDLGGREPEPHEFFTDARLRNLAYAYVFDAETEEAIDCVIASLDIEIITRGQAKSRSEKMASSPPDMFEDERTIAEILGLDKHDPWNVLSEEDKLASLLSEESKEKRKGVTGESFKPRGNLAKVTDVDMTRLADGSIRIDRVLAIKRPDMLFTVDEMDGMVWCCFAPRDYWETHRAIPDTHMLDDIIALGVPEGMLDEMAENQFMSLELGVEELKALFLGLGFVYEPALANPDEVEKPAMDVLAGRPFKLFYRLDVKGIEIVDAIKAFMIHDSWFDMEAAFLGWGEIDGTLWFANTIERLAEKHRDILLTAFPNIETEIYAANTFGERLVPKGVKVIGPNDVEEIGPRPWNDDASTLTTKPEVKPNEFIFAGQDRDQGVLIFITPKSYFAEHEAPWEGDLAPYVDDLLPGFLTRVQPNVYSTLVCDYEHMLQILSRIGFQESLLFKAWLNVQ